jgi:hypothetical protein
MSKNKLFTREVRNFGKTYISYISIIHVMSNVDATGMRYKLMRLLHCWCKCVYVILTRYIYLGVNCNCFETDLYYSRLLTGMDEQ